MKERTLKLSDAFENKKARADVELTVRMLNINCGHNKQLMEKCRVLEEYSQFVAATRECMLVEKDMQTYRETGRSLQADRLKGLRDASAALTAISAQHGLGLS